MNLTDPETYRLLYRIRRFEETILENFPKGVFYGTTHTYLGQEANAVGVIPQLEPNDIVFSNHRCHGHFISYGGTPEALFAELMGRAGGVCGGRGGSQHLHWRNFYSNGIQGGIVPTATGMALAEKLKGSRSIAVVFLGDGTLGEGVVYESLNMASLWQAPVLYVVENNHIAQTTPAEKAVSGSIRGRFEAFGIQTYELDSSEAGEITALAGRVINEVRSDQKPAALILHTCRFGPHSKGDDTRPVAEIEQMRRRRDPLRLFRGRLDESTWKEIEQNVDQEVEQAYQNALAQPAASFQEMAGL